MSSFLIYLLQVNLGFILLYLAYNLFFKGLTFHWVNRIILLLMLPISFVAPILNMGYTPIAIGDFTIPRFDGLVSMNQSEMVLAPSPSGELSVSSLVLIAYSIGLIISVFRLALSAFRLIHIKRQSSIISNGGHTIIAARIPSAFSCFRWIFVPLNISGKNIEPIVLHEKLHGTHWHSVDLILTELFATLLWFNPFVYFFRKSIRAVHEYQVDATILNGGRLGAINYLSLLVDNLENRCQLAGMYSYFNGLTIKKRVEMMTKHRTSRIHLVKYILIVPIVTLLVMSFGPLNGDRPELFPLEKGAKYEITSTHGQKMNNPFTKKEVTHRGIDIKAREGVAVLATAAGRVIKVVEEEGWGKLIVLDHGSGIESWYAHLKDFNVAQGETVRKGQVIGLVGNTGYSTAPHLHFEIRQNGQSIDPLSFVVQ